MPPRLAKSNTDPVIKDGDGDEPPPGETMSASVEVALNGYFVTISYADIDVADERYVLNTVEEVLDLLRKRL